MDEEPGDKVRRERRREPRARMEIPVRVYAQEADGSDWEELTAVEDASQDGASLTLLREIERGRILHLRMPLPKSIRQYDREQPAYAIYCLVRDVKRVDGVWRLGVKFLAKSPPPGYLDRPWAVFALRSEAEEREAEEAEDARRRRDARPEVRPEPHPELSGKRQFDRFDIFVTFEVQRIEGVEEPLSGALGVAENISHGGARLKLGLDLEPGQVIELRDVESDFEVRAEVRNTYVADDGVRRVNLQFLDGKSPTYLLGGG
jgi:hypothetical protein